MGVVYHIALYFHISHSHSIFYHCHRVTSNHRQFLDGHFIGLSSKYGDVLLPSQCLQVLFTKL